MCYYFEKCCFDSEKSVVIECDRMTCLSGSSMNIFIVAKIMKSYQKDSSV